MAWTQTTDAAELWRRAGPWLGEQPVENAPLLAEVAHLLVTDTAPAGLECGWWSDVSGVVRGAYVRAPRHNPLLTRMPRAALDELVALPESSADAVGVPGVVADDVVQAWAVTGTRLTPARSFTVHVLEGRSAAPSCAGRPRIAGPADEPMLHEWFDALMAGLPGDPSDRAYVVDDPLAAGGLVLWEVDGDPVAMCSRSRVLADTVRMGACYAPGGEAAYVEAAFGATAVEARRHARHVTVLAASGDEQEAARLAAAGFVPAATRVLLTAPAES
ncbi:hypothetical protein IEZ26_21880 [Nocardioides cavernae]|uniref:GNAT family N-acetyltransferase n=1 Tax=Nocardioides cavernae TaxID=1921566 RepID=A0ABR8NGP2_9ACTN|nr:hypothetical protein [Nocardioides cavernae]MBD3927287.1 hypothetical protein [Nocardioides cavernae]MBM7513110.1 hypothetical protein [Nocardioides cavernae]